MTALPIRGFALAATLLLAGCLGGGGKADLYRFGPAGAAQPATGAVAATIVVAYPGATFARPAASDRILTINGAQAGYIAKARWVAPAPDLFDAAALEAFDAHAPGLRIVRTADFTKAAYTLLLEVRRFEAQYPGDPKAAPDVLVETRARLVRRSDRAIVAEWDVARREHAAENRVTAIVTAFDRATAGVVDEIAQQAGRTVPTLQTS